MGECRCAKQNAFKQQMLRFRKSSAALQNIWKPSFNHFPCYSFTLSLSPRPPLILSPHPSFFSPEVSPEPAASCPGSLRRQGPAAWQRAESPLCWSGRRPGGAPRCRGWWWSLSGAPHPGLWSQSSAASQNPPADPPTSALLSEFLTWWSSLDSGRAAMPCCERGPTPTGICSVLWMLWCKMGNFFRGVCC